MKTELRVTYPTRRSARYLGLALLAVACTSRPEQEHASARSITVFPVMLSGTPSTDVANVVGIFLERGGLPRVELSDTAYAPTAAQDAATRTAGFGAFVRQQSLSTDHALLVDMLGTPGKSIDEISTTLVDRSGAVVFLDRQKRGDAAFDQSKLNEPMDGCVFVIQRLRSQLSLDDPFRSGAPESRLATRMQQRAGVPDQRELDAMHARLAALRAAGPRASLRVYPARVGSDWPAATATDLVARVQQSGLITATTATTKLTFAPKPGTNQQQVLWSGARAAQAALRKLPPSTDYALVCDFLPSGTGTFGAVHTMVFAADGELVLVDFQNSHHEDFQAVHPESVADCCELAARSLIAALRRNGSRP